MDGIALELFRHRFRAIAEEMGELLTRTGFSPNIKERRDHSCAVFDAAGDMVALAAHIPVHLGASPLCVKAVIAAVDLRDGATAIVNDPFAGGTHLPDITLVTAVDAGPHRFYVATRAHHADVGGVAPGSLPISSTIDDEGWRCAPTLLDDAVVASLLAASRTPEERRGDLAAQRAANEHGARQLSALARRFGADPIADAASALQDYAERRTRAAIEALPDGTVRVEDALDDANGDGVPVPIRLTATVEGGHLTLDLRESAAQVRGPMNAVRAIAESAAFYALLCLSNGDLPQNSGAMRCVTLHTTPGTVVDAQPPAAVAAGNVETSQRLVDVIQQAFAALAPERIPACSYGSMNNVLIGSLPGATAPFVYYETLGGGHGAGPDRAGASAMQAHMTNTLNTPIEALEHAFPLRVLEYAVRRGSGGRGRHRGGDGLVRTYELLTDVEVTLIGERRRTGAPGAAGGAAGAPGLHAFSTDGGDTWQPLPGKAQRTLAAGTWLRIETPGGGGFGPPPPATDHGKMPRSR